MAVMVSKEVTMCMRTFQLALPILAGFVLLALASLPLSACGPSPRPRGTGDDDLGGDMCGAGQPNRCVFNQLQACINDRYQPVATCSAKEVCTPELGCAECDPALGTTCVGDSVFTCLPNGQVGPLEQACGLDGCAGGACHESQDCDADGVELVYVVDTENHFLGFDPARDAHAFKLIGTLNCPAGPALPEYGGGLLLAGTPFSMSVDRKGRAWVLYTSGEIFWVDVTNANCMKSPFQVGSGGFHLFGMGFAALKPQAKDELLYVAGGVIGTDPAALGAIDPGNLTVQTIGTMTKLEYSPELSGTGNAELFAYYPGGQMGGRIAKVERATGQLGQSWDLPPLGEAVSAWAFAQWGGRFYVFVSSSSANRVVRLDPATGQAVTVVPSSPYQVVGAGVSTCAPFEIPD
jgi:hypothetical protein